MSKSWLWVDRKECNTAAFIGLLQMKGINTSTREDNKIKYQDSYCTHSTIDLAER